MKREGRRHARPGTHGTRLSVLFILLGLWGGVNGLSEFTPLGGLAVERSSGKEVTKVETGPTKPNLTRLSLTATLEKGTKVWCAHGDPVEAARIANEEVPLAQRCPELNDQGGFNGSNEDGDNRSPIKVGIREEEKDYLDIIVTKLGNGSRLSIYYERKEGRKVSTKLGAYPGNVFSPVKLQPLVVGHMLDSALKWKSWWLKELFCLDTTKTKDLFECLCEKTDDRNGTLQCGVNGLSEDKQTLIGLLELTKKVEPDPPAVEEVTTEVVQQNVSKKDPTKFNFTRLLSLNVTLEEGTKFLCNPSNLTDAARIVNEYVTPAQQCPEPNDQGGNEDGDNKAGIREGEKDWMDVKLHKEGNETRITFYWNRCREFTVYSDLDLMGPLKHLENFGYLLSYSFGQKTELESDLLPAYKKGPICYPLETTEGLLKCLCEKRDDRKGPVQCGAGM